MGQLKMLDVSADQHPNDEPIDWGTVARAGYRAVMVKASEGLSYTNPWCHKDSWGADAAGLMVGQYHFSHPGLSAPQDQADYFLQAAQGLPNDLGYANDFEVFAFSWAYMTDWAIAFHDHVRAVKDSSPLYVNDDYLSNLEPRAGKPAPWGYKLWLAQTPRPRRVVWAWQKTTPLFVEGISAVVDVDVLYGPLTAEANQPTDNQPTAEEFRRMIAAGTGAEALEDDQPTKPEGDQPTA